MTANTETWSVLYERDCFVEFFAAGHQRRRSHDAVLVALQDAAVDA